MSRKLFWHMNFASSRELYDPHPNDGGIVGGVIRDANGHWHGRERLPGKSAYKDVYLSADPLALPDAKKLMEERIREKQMYRYATFVDEPNVTYRILNAALQEILNADTLEHAKATAEYALENPREWLKINESE